MKKYPEFIRKNWVEHSLYLYLALFFIGADNSRPFGVCFDDGIGTLEPDLRTAYEKYINNYHPEFLSAVAIKQYYDILKRNDFMNKQEVEVFLKKNIYHDKEMKRWVVNYSS